MPIVAHCAPLLMMDLKYIKLFGIVKAVVNADAHKGISPMHDVDSWP